MAREGVLQIKRFASIQFLRLEDLLRTRNAAASAALSKLPVAFLSPSRAAQLAASVSVASYFPSGSLAQALLSRAKRLAPMVIDRWSFESTVGVSRSAIIKPYVSKRERGVLLVSFESELSKIVRLERFAALEADYKIVFLPTWQPFFSEPVSLLDARSTKPYFVMPSAFSEETLCDQFSPLCNYLPFHAASWVRGELYGPPAEKKEVDILMVANFSRHKRHWKIFEALSNLPPHLRVVLVGVPLGARSADSLLNEAELFGVEKRIEIVEKASNEELRRLLSVSKLLCAMSHKEGSYIAVAEALMAGVPVAMFETAKIGSKAYINDTTGFLLTADKPLGEQLGSVLNRLEEVNPQLWAKANISAEANCKKLNGCLRRWASQQEMDWSLDIEPFYCEHFEFRYFRDMAEDSMRAEYARVRELSGLTVRRT